ncbi:MAG: nucleotide sugar dehydrogenase [Acidimicrobiales bacterium]
MKTVVIVGQGYVGLPLSMRAVDAGYRVVAYDTDEERIKRLGAGDSYVEDVTQAELATALSSERFVPTTDPSGCVGFDVAVITVPTPLRDGAPDLSSVEEAGRVLGAHLRPGACVVLESTTYPGTTEELLQPILEESSDLVAGEDFFLGYSPERIDPGNRNFGLVNTPKIVSGINPASLEAVQAFYDTIVDKTVPVSGPGEAEMVKLIENTFRHVNIALVNELMMFAGDLGIDIWEALDAAETKPFGFMRFNPGPGVGGHCLPVDPSYLAWQVKRRVGMPFRFVELANDVNDHMPEYVVRRLLLAFNRQEKSVKGRRILLLGLAYKANTSDMRESPAFVIAERLRALGAEVRAADPYVVAEWLGERVIHVELNEEEVSMADAVVLVTDHDCFDLEMVARHATYVLDTRRKLTGPCVEQL